MTERQRETERYREKDWKIEEKIRERMSVRQTETDREKKDIVIFLIFDNNIVRYFPHVSYNCIGA